MRIVFDIQAQKIVAAFLWTKTRCAHDVDMGRSWVDLSAGTSLGVAISAEWLHICRAKSTRAG
jgi:hypothetical protein